MKPEVLKSWSLEIDYSRAPCLGADQKARGLWERDWQRDDSRVLMRMPCRVYLLPVAVLARPVVVSILFWLSRGRRLLGVLFSCRDSLTHPPNYTFSERYQAEAIIDVAGKANP